MAQPSPPPTGYTVPIRRVQECLAVAIHQGWDLEPALRKAHLSPKVLSEERSRVTTDQVAAFLQALWNHTDDELLGFGRAPVPIGTFRLIACATLANSPDLGIALDRAEEFVRALPGVMPLTVTHLPTETQLRIDLDALNNPVGSMIDALLIMIHRIFEWSVDQPISLVRVELPYAKPSDIDDYGHLFAAPAAFGSPAPALVFDASQLRMPVLRNEHDLDEFISHTPANLFRRSGRPVTMAGRVQRIMARQHRGGVFPSAADLAKALSVSPQTLRRKLRQEETSVRELREVILRDAAIESLARGGETVAELAERLGFSEPSTFIRAFRRWTGSSPRAYQPGPPD